MDITGTNYDHITLNGKIYEMSPLTPRMTNELIRMARKRAITNFYETAKETGMPFDLINAQINYFNKNENVDSLIDLYAISYLFWLRVKHTGVTLEEIETIPLDEIDKVKEKIDDSEENEENKDDKKKEN